MPIYEYRCEDCGAKFEKLLRRSADSDTVACPSCGQSRLTLQLSVFAAHRGSGKSSSQPMCPSGGPCPTPGACGLT